MKPRQVPIFLYWRVENVQFWINSIGHLGWLSCILNFPRFHKNVNSLELWKYISENSSPKGSFWSNKRKSEFSSLSADSRYLLAVALNDLGHSVTPTFLFRNRFHLQLSPHCSKMNKKSMWEGKKNFTISFRETWILPSCGCKVGEIMWSLNGNLFFEEPHQLTKFA